MRKITAKEAKAINERLGLAWDDGQRTFWAYDEAHDEIYDFYSKRERDEFVDDAVLIAADVDRLYQYI